MTPLTRLRLTSPRGEAGNPDRRVSPETSPVTSFCCVGIPIAASSESRLLPFSAESRRSTESCTKSASFSVVRTVKNLLAPASPLMQLDGFHQKKTYLNFARKYQPALIILGMGMPKQEQVAELLRSNLEHPCLIVCGGAIIDFLGDRVPRAPLWVRNFGIEWIFRLLQEPRRLFERYVLGNPLFLLRSFSFKRGRDKWSGSL